MGCNCNKNKTQGSSKTPMSAAASKTQQAIRDAQASQRSTMRDNGAPMKGKTQTFALVTRDGKTLKFGSRLEADAENVRLGYTGTVKPT